MLAITISFVRSIIILIIENSLYLSSFLLFFFISLISNAYMRNYLHNILFKKLLRNNKIRLNYTHYIFLNVKDKIEIYY